APSVLAAGRASWRQCSTSSRGCTCTSRAGSSCPPPLANASSSLPPLRRPPGLATRSRSGRAPMRIAELHRRITAGMALAALAGFISGAGLVGPAPVLAAGALVLALFWQPSRVLSAKLEPGLRLAALALAIRAIYHIVAVPDDVVLPMVDLLLLLLCAEALRRRDANGDARLHSLSFALLVASAAYRPGVGFAVAFLAYVALTTLALLVGHLRRQTEQRRLRKVSL